MLDRAELKFMAKEQIRGNLGTYFLCYLIYGLITGASAIVVVGPMLLAPPLMMGILMLFMGATRGIKPDLEDMFRGFNMFGQSVLLFLATGLFVFLWSLLFVIPGIIKAISYMFAPYILAENPDMPVMEAIKASKEMTRGHKGELFVMYLSFIPWFLLCGVTFGFAAIYVGPYVMATYTNAYNRIKYYSSLPPMGADDTYRQA